jgi:AcrR family transcriptional regulator
MAQTGLRERSKARRRAAIIRSAYELFAERGYHATTVADIAEAAEVSPRTVAMYFPAKQDIAMSRVRDGLERLRDAMRGRQPGETFTDALGRWLLSSQSGPEDGELSRLALRMFEANPELAALRQAEIADAIREGAGNIAAEAGIDRDGIGPRLASAASAAVMQELLRTEPGPEREQALATAKRFIDGGIAAL